MKAFYSRRPGISLLTLTAVFAAGSVLAWQTRGNPAAKPLPLASIKKRPERKFDWSAKLDLRKAEPRGDRLVQVLEDGSRVRYTIDPVLQKWAENYMAQYELPYGAMVMYDLDSGEVMVMAGHSSRKTSIDPQELCLTPWAPAASVFKLVTATALLENGVPGHTSVCYHGGLRGLQRHHIVDNPKRDTSCKSMSYAIAKSVNPIMAKLAVRYLSQGRLSHWAQRYGFNKPLPFELPVQPSKAEIPKGDLALARVAAGFWHTETSVLHGAMIGGVPAANGRLVYPHVVAEIQREDGRRITPERVKSRRVMSAASAQHLRKMMLRTTQIGTARRGFISRRGQPFLAGVEVGGKTGSLARKSPYLHYNWFVGFAPAEAPRVAFAVLLGNPARWHIKAHTAARNLLGKYLEVRKARDERPAVASARPAARAKAAQ